jgi:hypothetical protein
MFSGYGKRLGGLGIAHDGERTFRYRKTWDGLKVEGDGCRRNEKREECDPTKHLLPYAIKDDGRMRETRKQR